jgi:hypothetical protein
MLSCFYGGSVTDVNTATQCKDGISTTLGTTPRTVCSVTDGEGKLSLSGNTISSSRNHLGQPCASGTSDGSTAGNFTYLTSWLDSQSLGIWVQGAKATLNQVRTEMQNPAHQINIQSSACQALAQDYLTLLTFSKTLSDDQSSAIMASMPNVAAYDWKTCSPSSSTAKLTLDDSTMLPQASRCMTHAGGSQLLALYLQIAQCEVTGRADDLRAQLASQLNTAMGKMQQIAQDAGQAAQNEVNNDCRKGTYEWDCINSTDAKYCWIAYVAGAALGTGILIACLKEVPKLVSDVQSCAQSKMNQYAQSKQDSNFAASALTAAKSIISTVLQKASTADLDLTQTYSPKALPTNEYPAGSP